MKVSFIIVAKDAASWLDDLFADLQAQDYPRDLIEILLVAGPSSDNTLQLMEAFRDSYPSRIVRVLNNPRGILASGWNIALAYSTGEAIIRVDAHSRFGPSFISRSVDMIRRGENIAGGYRKTILPENLWPRILAIAEISKFGCGSAGFRNERLAGQVDTLAHAAYRREVFRTVGGYDERLVRTEDNEIHFRMKKAGYRFYYSPEIESLHYARSALLPMIRQKFGNGQWIGLTLGIQLRCFVIRHFIPSVFVASLLAGTILGPIWSWLPLMAVLSLYILTAIAFTVKEMARPEARGCRHFSFALPVLFLSIHTAYGLGTILGLIKMPIFHWQNRKYKLPHPITN